MMKYVKYTVGILIILVMGFFIMGQVKPHSVYNCEILVEKPVAESWAVAQDEEKMPDWLAGFQRVEHISGTPGAVGSVSMVYFDNDGQQMQIRETITEIVPEKSISMTFDDDFMTMDYTMSISGVSGKSKISSTTSATGNGAVAKSIMAFMGSALKAQEESNLENLKKVIEENTTDYFASEEEGSQ